MLAASRRMALLVAAVTLTAARNQVFKATISAVGGEVFWSSGECSDSFFEESEVVWSVEL